MASGKDSGGKDGKFEKDISLIVKCLLKGPLPSKKKSMKNGKDSPDSGFDEEQTKRPKKTPPPPPPRPTKPAPPSLPPPPPPPAKEKDIPPTSPKHPTHPPPVPPPKKKDEKNAHLVDSSTNKLAKDQLQKKQEEQKQKPLYVKKKAPAKTSASQDETDSKPAAVQKTAPAKRPAASTTQRKSISRPSTGSSSGAVDENYFQAAYEDVPSVSIFTTKQLEDDLSKMSTILNNDKADWELRVTALKKLRAFIIAGAAEYECFGPSLRQMEEALILSVKDLRSQVLREACITLAFLSIRLRRQFDHAAEVVLPHLFSLIQNSAKVMATSSMVAIDVIIRHTHSPRLIPIMKSNATSKSTAIRKQTFTYINTVLNVWDTHALERHASLLSEVIHKGIEDADSEARAVSRKAFWKFSEHFKSHADKMFNNLDASKQKMLQGELSQASSCTSLDGRPLSRSSTASSHENLRTASLPRRSVASRASRTSDSSDKPALLNQRSSSEINLAAASRARSRYSSAGQRAASGAAARISRSKSTSRESLAATPRGSSLLQTPNGRAGRTRSRIGVSQSQPGSRSNSRSSSPSTASSRYSNIQTNGRTRRKSGIPVPRSQGASREASPNRYGYASARERRQSGSSLGPAQREPKEKQNIMAQRVLVPGQDAEAALADALISAQRALRSNYGYGYDSDYSDNLITAQEYRSKASPRSALKASPRSTGSSPRGSYASNGPPDTEFLNSEDIYDSLRRTTAEIQNYMHSSRDDLDHVAVSKETRVDSDEGIADTMGRMTLTDGNYEDETFHEDHQDILVPLLTELSNHNGRFEERKNAMMQLIRLTRSESLSLWDDHFKTVLLLMLETLGDVESSIRAMALRVLREILRNQPGRFKDYAELTILKILEAHRDPHSEVVRQAEETSATLAISIAPSQCVRVLCPIIQTADCPINQAAIKMLTKIVELMSEADLMEILPEVIAVLLKSYDHTESSVRKASVFCLVAIHNIIGDKLKEKLADLPGCKMKLLNLYIKRAQAEKDAQTPSPSSPSALSTGSR